MPTNLLKVYNQLLELNSLSEPQRILSLKRVFNRDIVENRNFCIGKQFLLLNLLIINNTCKNFFRFAQPLHNINLLKVKKISINP